MRPGPDQHEDGGMGPRGPGFRGMRPGKASFDMKSNSYSMSYT